MGAVDVIVRKRDGYALDREAIDAWIAGVTSESWPDYQVTALLMAIVLNGMTPDETWWLTDAMVRSGARVDLSSIPGIKVGKHSTGGVGDKVSIVVAPLAASCGAVVPKMSGRGLGHTGGTLDKLESIPGFRTGLQVDEFTRVLREVGTCMIGQTNTLVPADRRLYALRDVTGTIESIPLIASSIMSKKLAEGSDALVLDVKCGDGAFMKDRVRARALGEALVAIGARSGVRTEAVVTAMDEPLGCAVGNALEIVECLDVLAGGGPPDLLEVVREITVRILRAGGVSSSDADAASAVDRALTSGRALERFRLMVERQHGDPRIIDDRRRLPRTEEVVEVAAETSGFVSGVAASDVGMASCLLGAGRTLAGQPVDHAVGIMVRVKVGAHVERGQPVFQIHHRNGRGLEEARHLCRKALRIQDTAPAPAPSVLDVVR